MDRAVYPGTFDPITNGHLDIIERARGLFKELIVAVAVNVEKSPMFTVEERLEMLRELTKDMPAVRIDSFEGMTVDYVKSQNTRLIVRGMRTMSDFENEFQMALHNRAMEPEIESIFIFASPRYAFLSSRLIKEVAHLGGNLSALVPPIVEKRLREKFAP